MHRFDERYDKRRHDDTRYPGDEFGGTYGYRDARDFGGSPYEAGRDPRQGQRHPGHRDFGGRHGYGVGPHPGHRDFGRGESPGHYDRDERDWSASGYPGGYRGVGPKGYSRTDERIREDLCERLAEHDAIDASGIEVRVAGGIVQLSGEVPGRHMKHLAEDAVADAIGVKDVENTLRVRRGEPAEERRGERGMFDEPSLD
ncbi:hypothetical protein J2T07_002753 [Luteibacter jiangsuensis]|uniref:BON domain-containing protein n=1 Tax=Luteibacter jiangsuensis TaxID=637577 RepID=A0ABT9SZX0_9GAMM|nr:BON domain-containing protein [Luteibacter jiangsuensis]MDQ0010563.1 hypothetical protein [Luteibacter jiangsuensis]